MSLSIDATVRVPQGDTRFVPFSLSEGDGSILELDGATILWKLQDTRTREDVLSLDDTGVSVRNRDDANGEFEIHIEPEATMDIPSSDYREVLTIIDGGGNRTTWVGNGTFIITEDG